METDNSQPNMAESTHPDRESSPDSNQRATLGEPPVPGPVDLPLGAQPRTLPSKFGRYEIGQLLGSGSTGAVYQALDTKLQRRVAIKVPHHFADDSPEVAQRFQREARAAANLTHANICPIYDVGEIGRTPYITMALVEGRTLGECLQREGPLPEPRAARIVLRLADALAEAHERGIVHRNLKLSNILVDDRDEPIVTDFGLARQADADESTIRVTQTGKILGTLAYMSPEQLLETPGANEPATDIYSLGVILYRLLSGRLPFDGSAPAMIAKILSHDPPPSRSTARTSTPTWRQSARRPWQRKRTIATPRWPSSASRSGHTCAASANRSRNPRPKSRTRLAGKIPHRPVVPSLRH